MGHHHHHHHHHHSHNPSETTPLYYDHHHHHHQSGKVTCKQTLIFILIVLAVVGVWFWWPTAVHLKSFSFSHLHITDHHISADWEIGLDLKTANYTDIRYTVVYCGDPTSQPIVDGHRKYDDLSEKQTTVYLRDSVERLVFNQMALSYMSLDVIRDGTVALDLVVKVTVMAGKYEKQYMMNCEGMDLTVIPHSRWGWNKQAALDGSGYASIPSYYCQTTQIY